MVNLIRGPEIDSRSHFFDSAGWNEYETGDFVNARNEFGDALALDSTSAGAQIGYAWTTMQIPGANVQDVLTIITDDATTDLEDWEAEVEASILADSETTTLERLIADLPVSGSRIYFRVRRLDE